MSNESSTLFKPLMPNQYLTVLLLIENSKKMYSVWEELKDCYLSPLIDAIARANNPAATSLCVVESSVDSTTALYAPRQYPPNSSSLSDVKFNFNSDGRISPGRVNDCIQHLDGIVYGNDALSAVHLVIVAASTPSDNCAGLTSNTGSYSPWTFLAEKLSERRIHCHLAMVPGHEDVTPLTFLFEHTLRLQNHVEEFPPFPVDQLRFIFRLSARPLYHAPGDPEHTMPTYLADQGGNAIGTASRRNSYLLDPQSDVNPSVTSFTPQTEISLVSHLKMAQGLIKKKQHSKDPQPAPFFGDARVQDATSQPYPAVPTSSPPTVASPSSASSSSSTSTLASTSSSSSGSSSSLSSVPLTSRHRKPQPLAMSFGTNPEAIPTNGGRAMSITKAERLQRINHATSGSSPTESVYMHGRRASQIQVPGAAAIGSIIGAPGQGVPNGTWFPSNSHGPQAHTQRGSPLSAAEQDAANASPALSASSLGSGFGSTSGTVVGAPSGAGLNMGMGSVAVAEVGNSVTEAFASGSPSIPMAALAVSNGMANQDMSPGSGSSYVGSDMPSPTTPGSMEEFFMHTRMQPLQHHGHGVTYQQGANQQNMAVAMAQDNAWVSQRQQQQQSLRLHQLQEMQMLQHQQEQDQQLQQLQQASTIPQQARYPSSYDPATSTYFPAAPPQQYYLPQQTVSMQPRVAEVFHPTAVPISDSVQDPQAHHTMQQYRQATRHPQEVSQSYNPYPALGTPVSASPPPMIVPSQSHVPLTAVHPPIGSAAPNPLTATAPIQGRMGANRSPPRSVPHHGPAHGRARASTMAGGTLSNLRGAASVPSLSKSARSKKHRKSASSTSHSVSTLAADSKATSSSATTAPPGDQVFEVSPLYAASTGVLFESMFNIRSSLLGGPAALASAEDVGLVAPALGLGREGAESEEVLATLSLGTVEAAGGLYQSSIRDRGAVVDEAAGTAVVPMPTVPGDISTTSTIPAATTMAGQSSTAARNTTMMSTGLPPSAAMPGSTFSGPPAGVGSLLPPNSTYHYPPQEVSQNYGTSSSWPY